MLTDKVPHSVSGEAFLATVKTSPPLAVVGAGMAGMSIDDWLKVAALIYSVVQTAILIINAWRSWQAKKNG